jgi:carbamoyl-phosphate synthase large subunit
MLTEKGFTLFATRGTAQFLMENGVQATMLHWPDEDAPPIPWIICANARLTW